MTREQESDWIKGVKALRREVRNHYASERFAEGDEANAALKKMEAFAISQGWRIPD